MTTPSPPLPSPAPPSLVRPAASPNIGITPIHLPTDQSVSIHHPGYIGSGIGNTQILTLRAYDAIPAPACTGIASPPSIPPAAHANVSLAVRARRPPPPPPPTHGVHYGTVLDACFIITCNRAGTLKKTDNTTPVTEMNYDDVLPAGKYWYHLNNDNDADPDPKYPTVPCFEEWEFDPTVIPADWIAAVTSATTPDATGPPQTFSESAMSLAVRTRDAGCCRITGHRDVCQNAHIIPRQQLGWFITNSMITYNDTLSCPKEPKYQIDDPRNGFWCRQDVHTAMDTGMFCVVCKEGGFVVHFFDASADLGRMYHNRGFRLPADACTEFMWARFAWTVLKRVHAFAAVGGRRIRLASGVVAEAGDGQLERSRQEREKRAQTVDRPGSPKKRKMAGGGTGQQEQMSEYDDFDTARTDDEPQDDQSESDVSVPPPEALPEPPTPSEQDIAKMQRFFPQMAQEGESEWSRSYTWQTAPWYPGMDRVEKLKRWWRRKDRMDEAPACKKRRFE